jgi:hypothetical protein
MVHSTIGDTYTDTTFSSSHRGLLHPLDKRNRPFPLQMACADRGGDAGRMLSSMGFRVPRSSDPLLFTELVRRGASALSVSGRSVMMTRDEDGAARVER